MLLPLLLGLLLTSQARAACSDPAAKASLDEDRLLGMWYTVKQPNIAGSSRNGAKCVHSVYSRAEDGHLTSLVAIYNISSPVYTSVRLHMHKAVAGSTDGKYDVHSEGEHGTRNGKLYVVDTDYDNYAVLWVCSQDTRREGTNEMYVLNTRQQHPSAELLEQANRALPAGDYRISHQTDCPAHEH
ncbi:lazarillo protein-like [Bacillus rossius redtenbacheri]|uniref:lazarillo protein-like n=1 Tax=Bacillus rossius redtenbacheri TaxID=93214 RepID=UPI002FDD1B04